MRGLLERYIDFHMKGLPKMAVLGTIFVGAEVLVNKQPLLPTMGLALGAGGLWTISVPIGFVFLLHTHLTGQFKPVKILIQKD